jgi:hypothetical protein
MKNSDFDIPARVFDFDKDVKYGESSEELVKGFLNSLSGGDFEVKSDRYRNGRMIVETQQNPKASKDIDGNLIWCNSGINVTKAKWWVYVFSPDGAFIIVSVKRLKRYLRINNNRFNEDTKKNLGGQDNPARGFLLYQNDITDLMTNKKYDEEI